VHITGCILFTDITLRFLAQRLVQSQKQLQKELNKNNQQGVHAQNFHNKRKRSKESQQ